MYLKNLFWVFIIILGFSDIWRVECSKHRRATKPPLIENSTTEAVIVENENENEKRYHHKPQNPPQYPPPYLPQNPPQSPVQYPPSYLVQNPPQTSPQYPPHFPPQDFPKEPQQYPIQIISQNPPQHPPQIIPQNPPQYRPPYLPNNPPPNLQQSQQQKPPSYVPQNPPNYPPHFPPQLPQQNPPQITTQYPTPTLPHNPPQHTPLGPQLIQPTTILDQFDNRSYDGSYEYRYELSDESVRYERGYFITYLGKKILVVKGYYSHRLRDHRYLTVFYTADQFGNRQNTYFSSRRPLLPRSLNTETETDSVQEANRSFEINNSTAINEDS